jgi:hypothetical protein
MELRHKTISALLTGVAAVSGGETAYYGFKLVSDAVHLALLKGANVELQEVLTPLSLTPNVIQNPALATIFEALTIGRISLTAQIQQFGAAVSGDAHGLAFYFGVTALASTSAYISNYHGINEAIARLGNRLDSTLSGAAKSVYRGGSALMSRVCRA